MIIPAYNEESVIQRTIRSVLGDTGPDVEVIVVANGCQDRTAEMARACGDRVQVIETDVPGKCNAINLGESIASTFPRAYLDGDVLLSAGALPLLFNAIEGDIHVASASATWDTRSCTMPARLAYRISMKGDFHFGLNAPNGSGTYVLSEKGRSRWKDFPEILNDDGFVGLHFQPHESMVVKEAEVTVFPPRSISALIPARTRSRRGRHQLQQDYPDLCRNMAQTQTVRLASMAALRPWLWPSAICYGYVKILERISARRMDRPHDPHSWGHDRSTRK